MLTKEEIKKTVKIAKSFRENAFVPRSGHKVGACVLTVGGEYFGGCNIESVVSGEGACAEKVAINNAAANGKYEFRALAVVDQEQIFPCGSCLQYLLQFYQINNQDIPIVIADVQGNYQIKNLKEFLPYGYISKALSEKLKKYHRA